MTMREKKTDLILKEGFKPLFYAFVALVVLFFLGFGLLSLIAVAAIVLIFFFFINPEREPEEEDAFAVIAPIDGKITEIAPHSDGVAITISNFFLDPHLIRAPFDTEIESIKIRHGVFLSLSNPNAQALNQRGEIVFKNKNARFVLTLLNSLINIENSFYVKEREPIKANKRVGFFGGGQGVFHCPKNVDLKVSTGDNLKAGESLIGFIKNA